MSSERKRGRWAAGPRPSLCSGSPCHWLGREGGQWRRAPGTGGATEIQELFDEFSLLGELEDEEEEEEEKFIPVSPGGFVAVFCPLKLFRHTGQVSCFREQTTTKQEMGNRVRVGNRSSAAGAGWDDDPSPDQRLLTPGLITGA